MHVYQPLTGLHRPIALDPSAANFTDLDVAVRCLDGPALDSSQAGQLCRRVARLFENQGARVEVYSGAQAPIEERGEAQPTEARPADAQPRAALSITISAREIRRETTTIIPWAWELDTDYTVAQDIQIRDETGFLLVQDTLVGRFTTRIGFMSDAEDQFSGDFYGQLSQLALNAKVRRRVLGEGKAAPAGGAG